MYFQLSTSFYSVLNYHGQPQRPPFLNFRTVPAPSQHRFQHPVTTTDQLLRASAATERVHTAFTVPQCPFNTGFKSAALEAGMNVLRMLQPAKVEQEDWVGLAYLLCANHFPHLLTSLDPTNLEVEDEDIQRQYSCLSEE